MSSVERKTGDWSGISDLRRVRSFVAVADQLHFRRAAEQQHFSQPALSAQIRKLEDDLRVALLVRDRRSVELTPAGAAFLPEARALLAQAARAAERTRRAAAGELGELRIGFVGSAMHGPVPEAVRALRGERPEVHVDLRELGTEDQLDGIRENSLDVGFIRPPAAGDGVEIVTVLREPVVAALPSGHPLSGAETVALDAIAREPIVLFPRSQAPGFHAELLQRLRGGGHEPVIVQEAPEMQTIVGLVGAGVGVSLVPASVEGVAPAGVRFRPLTDRDRLWSELAVAYRTGNTSPILGHFLGIVTRARG